MPPQPPASPPVTDTDLPRGAAAHSTVERPVQTVVFRSDRHPSPVLTHMMRHPATRVLDVSSREVEPRDGDLGYGVARVKGINTDARTVSAIVSTPAVDRMEEIIEAQAFAKWLDQFMTNPVLKANHADGRFMGRSPVIGHWFALEINDEGLIGTCQFATTELGEEYWQLYRDGHMRAFSVGFIAHAWEMRELEMGDGSKRRLRVFTEVELVEISCVDVPANRQALVRAARSDGDALGFEQIRNLLREDRRQLVAELTAIIQRLLREELPAGLDKALEKALDFDTGGPVCILVQNIIEGMLRCLGVRTCRYIDGDLEGPQPGGARGIHDPGITEFKNQLKQALGQ